MQEQKKISMAAQQRKDRPKIETLIPRYLPDEKVNIALDFAAWLRENRMNPGHAGIFNAWRADCKGKPICRITLMDLNSRTHDEEPNKQCMLVISLYLYYLSNYEKEIINEGLQNLIWDNIRGYCTTGCHSTKGRFRPCYPGRTLKLIGKEFKRVCCCDPFTWIYDPDKTAIEGIKKLLAFEKKARIENSAGK